VQRPDLNGRAVLFSHRAGASQYGIAHH
jgi:hypothetical protein